MSESIAYQNKDIISKVFMESFGSKSLDVYGLHVPKGVRLLPTNLPAIEAKEWRIDNLLELQDGSIAILDYESKYKDADKAKYLNYISRVFRKLVDDGEGGRDIRMLVIYTADVKPDQVKTHVAKSGFTISIDAAYLSEHDSDEIRARLSNKIKNKEKLVDEELMELIILPLTYKSREKKQEIIKESIELAKQVTDEKQSTFLVAGIVVFSDKVIDEETRKHAKEWMKMTQIGRMFEQEKIEAVEKAKQEEERNTARQIVSMIDNLAKNTIQTIEDACAATGIDTERYAEARKLLVAMA